MSDTTYEVPCGNGVVAVLRKRFPSTSLARVNEQAPKITEAFTEFIIGDDKRKELLKALDGKPIEKKKEIIKDFEEDQKREFVDQGFEIVRAPLSELDAIHEFCVDITETVKNATKLNGEPLAWSDADRQARKDFYDCDVPTMSKLTIYVYAWMLKNGVDPDSLDGVVDLNEMKDSTNG